jgi:hypothetical protein
MPEVTGYYLEFDNGYHEEKFDTFPPDAEIADARRAAPDAWTYVVIEHDGWKRMEIASWPPIESDPRVDG